MSSLRTTRDVYGPATSGGPIERRSARVRRLSEPRERTLTELGLREQTAEGRHESLWEEPSIEQECGD